MQLENSFTVDVDTQRAWDVLTDVPAIAPCLPGAQLQEVEGEEYRGIVKVKVGPIVAQYKGKAMFVERNEADRTMVLRAEGRETRGQGSASADISVALQAMGEQTEVVVVTELTVTGKVAQFGRGVMADVSAKLMDQFAQNLAERVLDADQGDGGAAAEAPTDGGSNGSVPAPGPTAEPEPIDLLGTAGAPAAMRLLPPIVAVVVAVILVRRILRRRRG